MKIDWLHKSLHAILWSLMFISLACAVSFNGSNGANEVDPTATRAALGATQTALAAPLPEEKDWGGVPPLVFNGVSLVPPAGWNFIEQTMPAEQALETFWNTPAHDQWEVMDYPVTNDYHQPAIQIFSVQDYQAINDLAAEQIRAIRAALDARPTIPAGTIPFLPTFNATQMGQVKVAFLDFQNGSGLRFLTQFGQDFWLFTNRRMVYAFIGLTDDGRYLVSALLPVAHSALEPYTDFQPPDDFYETAENFLNDQINMLNSQSDGTFLPSLPILDGLIASIWVDK